MGNSELKVTGKQKTLVDDVWIKAMFRPGVSFTGRWLLQPLSPVHSWNTRWLCLECVLGYLHQILIAYAFEACVSWMKKTCIEYPVCCTKLAFYFRICVHAQLCPTLFFFSFCFFVSNSFCGPLGYSLPGSSVHGISQARMLEWVAISSCRGSSQPARLLHCRWILYLLSHGWLETWIV